MTAVTKLESLKYVEWAHGSALECVCASHPLFFFVISQMKKEGKNKGQRFHMILKNAFGPMNVAVVLASSGPPVGLDWVTCHNMCLLTLWLLILCLVSIRPRTGSRLPGHFPGQELHLGLFFDWRKRCE